MSITQNNTKDSKPSVNTNGIQFSNKDGFEASTLVLGYWNDKLSIKMHPALEKSKQTEKQVFDYDHSVMTSLTVEKMQTLLDGIEEYILPALISGIDKSVSVIVGSDSLVTIGTGLSLAGRIAPYLAIHKSLQEGTRKPESSIYYEFKSSPIVLDYEAVSGSCEQSVDKFAEFKAFLNCVKFAIATLMNAGVHVLRHSDKYYRDKLLADITAIANKLGIATADVKKFTSKPDVFGLNKATQPRTTPQVNSADYSETIDSLDNFMED